MIVTAIEPRRRLSNRKLGSDKPFVFALAIIGSVYILLILAMLLADVSFLSPIVNGRDDGPPSRLVNLANARQPVSGFALRPERYVMR